VRGKITATNGKAPGWRIECKVLGVKEKDECTTENSSGSIENKLSNGELLVLGAFDEKSAKGTCTVGGKEASVQEGAGYVASPNGLGLRIGSGSTEKKSTPSHWYKEGSPLAESSEASGLEVGTGSGTSTVSITDTTNERQSKCEIRDSGKVWNPIGGEAGKESIESATFTGCTSMYCTKTPELKAEGLPWRSELIAGTPILLEIKSMVLSIICNGGSQGKYTGTVSLKTLNGEGKGEAACIESTHTTFVEFLKEKNELKFETGTGLLEGKDCVWGKASNEKVSVNTP
jgi:hypothetical protein